MSVTGAAHVGRLGRAAVTGAAACAFALAAIAAGGGPALADGYAAGSLVIDAGALATADTEVSLAIAAPADAAGRVRLSNDGSTWREMDWAPTVGWSLVDPDAGGVTGDGSRTVTLEYGDGTTWSDPASASILLDTTAPTVDSFAVNVIDPANEGWGAQYLGHASDDGSGLDASRMSLNGTDWSDWTSTGPAMWSDFDLRMGLLGGTVTGGDRAIFVEVRDKAGNVSDQAVGHVTLPDFPNDKWNFAPVKVTMSEPLAPVTGQSFTLRPNYPPGYVFPADAFCQWHFHWGSMKSLVDAPPDQYYGEINFQRPASKGGCTEWTFTLPYSEPRLYKWAFTMWRDPTGGPDYTGLVELASIGAGSNQNIFHAALGTTERRILHSNLGITYLLPETTTPAPGKPMTYRLYATDAATPPQTGMFWAYPIDCYINPQLGQQGGTTFTFTPSCPGPWDAGWTGTYHGPWYMRNQFDPVEDRRAPAVHGPFVSLAATRLSGASAPATISWWATDSQTGVHNYELQVSRNGGAWAYVLLPSRLATSVARNLGTTGTYRFRVRARDRAGTWSAWRTGSLLRAGIAQQSSSAVRWTGAWTSDVAAAWSAGSLRTSSAAGATATYRCSCRGLAWVTATGPGRGLAQVWIDGTLAATVNLEASSLTARRVVFRRAWTAVGTHAIRITVLGTATVPRVDVDAFLTLR